MRIYSFPAIAAAVLAAGQARAQQSVSPFISFGSALESSRGAVMARWSGGLDQSSPTFGEADLASRTRLMQLGPFESSVLATGHYDRTSLGASGNAAFRLQIGSSSPTRGMQFGLGAEAWRSSGDQQLVPASTASAWIRRFGLSFTAEVTARSLPGGRVSSSDTGQVLTGYKYEQITVPYSDTAIWMNVPQYADHSDSLNQFTGAHTFGETRFRVSGMLMDIGLDAQVGYTMATRGASRSFGSLILTRWLSPAIAVTGGVVVQPQEPGSTVRRSGGLLGIRLATGPRLLPSVVNAPKTGVTSAAVRLADGRATLELRAPGAGHVEVSGDFTRWTPVALDRASGDRWILVTPLAPGLHRLVIRVDGGEWRAPPGLPQAVDPYEGNVGVIVAP